MTTKGNDNERSAESMTVATIKGKICFWNIKVLKYILKLFLDVTTNSQKKVY